MLYTFNESNFFSLCLILVACNMAHSAEPTPIKNSGELFQQFDTNADAAENISGLTCSGNNNCIAVADEMIAIQMFKLHFEGDQPTIEAGRELSTTFSKLCSDISDKDECEEVDLEGIARSNNEVFVTGSLGNKKNKGKPAEKRWFVSKITLNNIDAINAPEASVDFISTKSNLYSMMKNIGEIGPYLEKPLQCYGLNVEGLAHLNDTIYFGLRSPVDRKKGIAYLVSTNRKNLNVEENHNVTPSLHTLEFIENDGTKIEAIGIRAIETFGDRLLIVTGANEVSEPRNFKSWKYIINKCDGIVGKKEQLNISFKRNALSRIWIWDPNKDAPPKYITTIEGDYKRKKLEGLTVIHNNGATVDLLLAFDDPKKLAPLAIIRKLSIPQ